MNRPSNYILTEKNFVTREQLDASLRREHKRRDYLQGQLDRTFDDHYKGQAWVKNIPEAYKGEFWQRRMGRIGSFNPSSQGPVEPPDSIEEYINTLEDYIETDKHDIERRISDNKEISRKLQALIDQRKCNNTLIKEQSAEINENLGYIIDLKEQHDNLISQRESLTVEIELLEEDPGNEEKVLRLKTKIRDINNRL